MSASLVGSEMCIRDRRSSALSSALRRFPALSGAFQCARVAEKHMNLPEAAPRLAKGVLVVCF
eukprot:11283144-Alexandrium_andersonii.AAC.1